ncbi:Cyclopentanol dehydrogenase [Hartmannibacter diazotrophicus]|uniref:Cyclopentanol dehydrogenase n=1 Tax=Hartmannibacter diazotrophicus TaxID=1482074 RepID=A0A2C9D9B5_9HYPH|nr:SDR family oxidoreductase [Hartmannibacter diazotrophicus]SON56760.1 Cyclopentanol dehydrogenase [Hartmannibacter diazotrophicus]
MILKDRVAIVTGAGSGIGQGGAQIMAREGAHVVVVDRNLERARDTVDMIAAAGGSAEAKGIDVTNDEAMATLVEDVRGRHGRIDILHNHAGIQVEGTLESVSVEGFDASLAVNVRAHFIGARLVMPAMRALGKGVILNTSSSSGVFYDREMIAYTTSKHAVVAMTRQIAADYARFNIRVNALCPGWVDTPFNDPFIRQMGGREAIEAYIAEKVPMGRWASIEEIAETILFLVSDRSSYITGQAIVADGGETI